MHQIRIEMDKTRNIIDPVNTNIINSFDSDQSQLLNANHSRVDTMGSNAKRKADKG